MNQLDVQLAFRAGSTSVTPLPTSIQIQDQCSKVLIQVIIPEHHWKFVYKVPTSTLVRELLRRVFASCHLDLFEYANYGLYIPPTGTQKGKFLQEERLLSEYPQLLSSPADDLEDVHSPPFIDEDEEEQMNRLGNAASLKLIRKCRYVDGLPMSHARFKQANSKYHRKQLLLAIQSHDLQRIELLLNRGLDPNFQHKSTGDTPLCYATQQWHPRELILKLVENGAHLEFRDSDTLTPLHRAAIVGNFEAIKALLDLGQNPNVRDARDLTPLYHAVSQDVPTRCITQLLYDHAILGVMDDKNRQEIHQACLFDRPQHLEQLIIYGADLDAQTTNLDTPLHICALNNHEACLRLLLRHGASRCLVNASDQTPSQVAMLTGLNRLAEIIDTFTDDQIVPITKPPVYNQDRKPSATGPRAAYETILDRASIDYDDRGDRSTPTRQESRGSERISTLTSHDTMTPTPHSRPRHSNPPRVISVIRSPSASSQIPLHMDYSRNSYHNSTDHIEPRIVTLQRSNTGFGFQIRGRRGDSLDSISSHHMVANQYIDRILPGSPADQANLSPGDYILEINGQDVTRASHYEVTDLIVQSGTEVTLTVLSGSYPTSAGRQAGLRRERSRILMADRRRSCHRTPSMTALRDGRFKSQGRISSQPAHLRQSASVRYTSMPSSSSDQPPSSVGTTPKPPSPGRSQSTISIFREIPIQPLSPTVSSELRRSISSNEEQRSSPVSYSSNSDVFVTETESNSSTGPEWIVNSSVVSKPYVLIVHGSTNRSVPPSVNHAHPKPNGLRNKNAVSSSCSDPFSRVDVWPNVSHL